MPDTFTKRVLNAVCLIARGETKSYREIAEQAGSPRAYRAVGSILKKNYNPDIPCHRVIHTDGSSGAYNRGARLKEHLLRAEKQPDK